ncbi:MAG: Ig-like domain-containing protein [Oscillospiraceae bacterium]
MHHLRPFGKAMRAVLCTFCLVMLGCARMLQPCVHGEETPATPAIGLQEYDICYTASEALTAQMNSVFAGNINLAMDADRTPVSISLTVASALDIRTTYYAYNSSSYVTGMQCYIYAQAVYATLFDDLPYHGAGTKRYDYSAQVMGQSPTVDYRAFTASQVMPGAYLRTTDQPDGTYNGSVGHSLIVLGYNEDGLTILEGNADNRGLIRIASYTWDDFNERVLTRYGRVISHVVQPREDVYRDQYGLTFEALAAGEDNDTPPVSAGEFSMHRQNGRLQLPELGDGFTWSSSDETIATVDENGELTAIDDGTVTIIATNGMNSYSYTVTLSLVAWEQLGDLNGDSAVNTTDAILLLRQYTSQLTGTADEPDEHMQRFGDIDDNGVLDTADAVLVLRYYVATLSDASLSPEARWHTVL